MDLGTAVGTFLGVNSPLLRMMEKHVQFPTTVWRRLSEWPNKDNSKGATPLTHGRSKERGTMTAHG
jgi:hypothetical protein